MLKPFISLIFVTSSMFASDGSVTVNTGTGKYTVGEKKGVSTEFIENYPLPTPKGMNGKEKNLPER